MNPICTVEERIVYQSRFGTLHDDLVRSPSGAQGTYLRWLWRANGVVAVPVCDGHFALVRHYRYPIGRPSLEFPRGGCEASEDARDAARRELLEELGLTAGAAEVVGKVHADTGLIATPLVVVVVRSVSRAPRGAMPEVMESIDHEVLWQEEEEFRRMVVGGDITCAITLASFFLAAARLRCQP